MATGTRSRPQMVTVTRAFEGVGAGLWRCSRCHGPATYSNPLILTPAPAASPYSHLFMHREGCAA